MTTPSPFTLKPLIQIAVAAALLSQASAYEIKPITATQARKHLKSYDPTQSPVVVQADFIQTAALDYYDKYWTPYWQRLRDKHAEE